ncbi:MAG: hypothetical protein CSA45_04805 [Gammaproteobacteria bacterium]|nr:MAG: hypothetical protein CSA45_04805 [Gammaproteobacteria bacterium]
MSSSEKPIYKLFEEITDPRQQKKVKHHLVELLTVSVVAVLCGATTSTEIELYGRSCSLLP